MTTLRSAPGNDIWTWRRIWLQGSYSISFSCSQQITAIKGWRQTAASTPGSLRVLAHPSRHRRGSKMKVSGWEGGRERGRRENGRGGWKRGGNKPGPALVFPSLHLHHTPPLFASPLPSQKKHSFPSSSSRSPPNPPLLRCICFLIRSVWEAHEPFPTLLPLLPPPPFHPRPLSPFSWWL